MKANNNILEINNVIKKAEIIEQDFNGQFFIIVVRDGVADMENVCCLSNTSYDVWKLIRGEISIKEIVNQFMKIYNVDYTTAKRDILEFLGESLIEGMILKIK